MRRPDLLATSLRFCALVALAPLFAGCGDDGDSARAERSGVAVTFFPLEDWAERMIGPEIEVRCPLPEGEDPIFWQPDSAAMESFRTARLVVSNGAEFEKWLAVASLPESRHVRTADGFSERFLEFEEQVAHSHGPSGEHVHMGVDGHTWVDPLLAIEQVRALEQALVEAYPEHAGVVHDRADALVQDLEQLDGAWAALVPRLKSATLLASHPAYRYVAERYGLDIVNFDLDPDALLEPDDAAKAERLARESERPTLMLWESTPRPDLVAALRDELGIVSVVISPAENPGVIPDGGYVGIQRDNLVRLTRALDGLAD
ncbi:High-affinity zinc uptake system binding-protein ZnuA precursor [Planctomycetes bacterium Pla163]|uniref:High-affinity zinc uptake system binding-protein ZnuA n=1 Tax=Rohdeia mirabilis TaxID=2528008 RepID=A0A518CZ90_9BACT|nr:High-affinity zinc uptake system binding-protein ZnuA precursor [Planctomycetes bacterium Pla163]